MGNSPSKNEPLPTNSNGQTLGPSGTTTDLDADDKKPPLSRQYDYKTDGKYETPSSQTLKKYENTSDSNINNNDNLHKKKVMDIPSKTSFGSPTSKDMDLDLEIYASMAKLLTTPSSNSHRSKFLKSQLSEYSSSLESEKSDTSAISPVFTQLGESKDEDLLLSVGLALAGEALYFKNDLDLDTIAERSVESTPEPWKTSLKNTIPSITGSTNCEYSKTPALNHFSSNHSNVVKKSEINIDEIIDRLVLVGMKKNVHGFSSQYRKNKDKLPVSGNEIKYILQKSRSIFLDQPTLLKLCPPVKIVGDIHGQFHDLIRIFKSCGFPPNTNYLFLGDYVDRGHKSLETILLLLCYKIKYPENFFMLRGNHESANITKIYGFYDECKRRLPQIAGTHKLWKMFVDVFNTLPIAATINNKIFCIHGGLSPELQDLKQIETIKRPTDIPDTGLLADLLWSDPDSRVKTFSISKWPKNDRGVSYCFGKKHVDYFCSQFKMELIVRGHMVVEDGYEFFDKRKLVTVFLAPNYCGEFNNYGAVMGVDKTLCCSFELIKPQ